MEATEGTITSVNDGYTVENKLFTYSEDEKEELKINKMNADLILKPQFFTVDYAMLHNGYSRVETALYGFIKFFLTNNERFYCTNEQLAEMLCSSETSVSLAIKKLKEDGLINLTFKPKADGGRIRFVRLSKSESPTFKIGKSDFQNLKGIYNKIIDNKKIYMFQNFWKDYPHARKGKKKDSEKYFNECDANEVKKQVQILKRKIRAGLMDGQYVPACERWIRDFTPINDDIVKQDLVKICKWHLSAGGDMKERSHELKETFGEKQINDIVKAIQQKDNPKNLFIKP